MQHEVDLVVERPLTRPERAQKMRAIADGAANLSLKTIYVYSNSEPVAEIHDGNICLEAACRTLPSLVAER